MGHSSVSQAFTVLEDLKKRFEDKPDDYDIFRDAVWGLRRCFEDYNLAVRVTGCVLFLRNKEANDTYIEEFPHGGQHVLVRLGFLEGKCIKLRFEFEGQAHPNLRSDLADALKAILKKRSQSGTRASNHNNQERRRKRLRQYRKMLSELEPVPSLALILWVVCNKRVGRPIDAISLRLFKELVEWLELDGLSTQEEISDQVKQAAMEGYLSVRFPTGVRETTIVYLLREGQRFVERILAAKARLVEV